MTKREKQIKLLNTSVNKWNRYIRFCRKVNINFSADLSGANLRNSDLRNHDLSNSNLRSADLRYANLKNADLRDADLDFSCLDLSCKTLKMKNRYKNKKTNILPSMRNV